MTTRWPRLAERAVASFEDRSEGQNGMCKPAGRCACPPAWWVPRCILLAAKGQPTEGSLCRQVAGQGYPETSMKAHTPTLCPIWEGHVDPATPLPPNKTEFMNPSIITEALGFLWLLSWFGGSGVWVWFSRWGLEASRSRRCLMRSTDGAEPSHMRFKGRI